MNKLLAELGKKLAERWLSLLVLPGALYLATLATARALGHSHAIDVPRLIEQVTAWANAPAARTVGGQAVLLAAILAGSAAIGLAAQYLGSVTERIALASGWASWPPPLRGVARTRVTRRRRQWNSAEAAYQQHRENAAEAITRGQRLDPTLRHAAYRAMTHIALEEPDRPTWVGDRVHAVTIQVERDHHLDLATVWPYLWLTIPDTVRTEITAARAALSRATTLVGWGMLYLPLARWWWPAALISAALTVAAWQRARSATDIYALLLEAATRLHAGGLARHLGLDHAGPLDPQTGDALTRLLQGERPPPGSTQ